MSLAGLSLNLTCQKSPWGRCLPTQALVYFPAPKQLLTLTGKLHWHLSFPTSFKNSSAWFLKALHKHISAPIWLILKVISSHHPINSWPFCWCWILIRTRWKYFFPGNTPKAHLPSMISSSLCPQGRRTVITSPRATTRASQFDAGSRTWVTLMSSGFWSDADLKFTLLWKLWPF